MPKKIGMILLIILIIILFFMVARKYVANIFLRDKGELTEARIIGTVTGYNPRVKEIQNILEDLGFEVGTVDGRMGAQTRRAIKEFQKTKELMPSGKIDPKTWASLSKEKEKIIEHILTPETTSDLSFEKTSQKSAAQDEVISYRLKSKERIRQVQIALQKAGFYKGEIDGKLGPQTKGALKAFQKSRGLDPDGIIGSKTWKELSRLLKD